MIRIDGDDYVIVVTSCPSVDKRIYAADFVIHEVVGRDGDEMLYKHDEHGVTGVLTEAAARVTGHARWDGCVTVTVNDAHLCTSGHLERLFIAIRRALKACADVVTAGGALQHEYK